jgi:GNAT superfamily N-acetyltransferase
VERKASPVVIRSLSPGDSLQELTQLLHRAYRPLLEAGFRYLATHQDASVTAQRVRSGECYVAELEEHIVGTVTLEPPWNTKGGEYYRRPGVACFHQFAVDPSRQGRGIGSALLQHVERRAAELGATEIALDTAEGAVHLIALYERRGYRTVARTNWDVTNYESVIMSKAL